MRWAIALAVITALEGCAPPPYWVDMHTISKPPKTQIVPRGNPKPKWEIRGRWGERLGTIE
jgi:hypothetical protein